MGVEKQWVDRGEQKACGARGRRDTGWREERTRNFIKEPTAGSQKSSGRDERKSRQRGDIALGDPRRAMRRHSGSPSRLSAPATAVRRRPLPAPRGSKCWTLEVIDESENERERDTQR